MQISKTEFTKFDLNDVETLSDSILQKLESLKNRLDAEYPRIIEELPKLINSRLRDVGLGKLDEIESSLTKGIPLKLDSQAADGEATVKFSDEQLEHMKKAPLPLRQEQIEVRDYFLLREEIYKFIMVQLAENAMNHVYHEKKNPDSEVSKAVQAELSKLESEIPGRIERKLKKFQSENPNVEVTEGHRKEAESAVRKELELEVDDKIQKRLQITIMLPKVIAAVRDEPVHQKATKDFVLGHLYTSLMELAHETFQEIKTEQSRPSLAEENRPAVDDKAPKKVVDWINKNQRSPSEGINPEETSAFNKAFPDLQKTQLSQPAKETKESLAPQYHEEQLDQIPKDEQELVRSAMASEKAQSQIAKQFGDYMALSAAINKLPTPGNKLPLIPFHQHQGKVVLCEEKDTETMVVLTQRGAKKSQFGDQINVLAKIADSNATKSKDAQQVVTFAVHPGHKIESTKGKEIDKKTSHSTKR